MSAKEERELAECYDVQANEIEALRAIYAGDFGELSRREDEFNFAIAIRLDLVAEAADEQTLRVNLIVKYV